VRFSPAMRCSEGNSCFVVGRVNYAYKMGKDGEISPFFLSSCLTHGFCTRYPRPDDYQVCLLSAPSCCCQCRAHSGRSYSHISPFVFTTTLLPLMIKTAEEKDSDVRIVNVSLSHFGISVLSGDL
jgi:hypothetical protein